MFLALQKNIPYLWSGEPDTARSNLSAVPRENMLPAHSVRLDFAAAESAGIKALLSESVEDVSEALHLLHNVERSATEELQRHKPSMWTRKKAEGTQTEGEKVLLNQTLSDTFAVIGLLLLRSGSFIKGAYYLKRAKDHMEKDYIKEDWIVPTGSDEDELKASVLYTHGVVLFSMSLVPPKFLWIVSALGFAGDPIAGKRKVANAAIMAGTSRAPLALHFLLWMEIFFFESYSRSLVVFDLSKRCVSRCPTLLYLEGHLYREKGDLPLSLSTFHRASASCPGGQLKASILYEISYTLFLQGRWEKARDSFVEFLERSTSKSFKAYAAFQLGLACLILGDTRGATSSFSKVPQLCRKNFSFDEYAQRKSEEYLESGFRPHELDLLISSIYNEGKDYTKSIDLLNGKENDHQNDVENISVYWYNYGLGLWGLGKYQNAIDAFEKVTRLNVKIETWTVPYSLFGLGECYRLLNQVEKSVIYYQKTVNFNGNYDLDKPLIRRVRARLTGKTGDRESDLSRLKQWKERHAKKIHPHDEKKLPHEKKFVDEKKLAHEKKFVDEKKFLDEKKLAHEKKFLDEKKFVDDKVDDPVWLAVSTVESLPLVVAPEIPLRDALPLSLSLSPKPLPLREREIDLCSDDAVTDLISRRSSNLNQFLLEQSHPTNVLEQNKKVLEQSKQEHNVLEGNHKEHEGDVLEQSDYSKSVLEQSDLSKSVLEQSSEHSRSVLEQSSGYETDSDTSFVTAEEENDDEERERERIASKRDFKSPAPLSPSLSTLSLPSPHSLSTLSLSSLSLLMRTIDQVISHWGERERHGEIEREWKGWDPRIIGEKAKVNPQLFTGKDLLNHISLSLSLPKERAHDLSLWLILTKRITKYDEKFLIGKKTDIDCLIADKEKEALSLSKQSLTGEKFKVQTRSISKSRVMVYLVPLSLSLSEGERYYFTENVPCYPFNESLPGAVEIARSLSLHDAAIADEDPFELSVKLSTMVIDLIHGYHDAHGSPDYLSISLSLPFKTLILSMGRFAGCSPDSVLSLSRSVRLSLFLNLYNLLVFVGLVILGPPTSYLKRRKFYKEKTPLVVKLSIWDLSIDEIEHGLLRGNKPPPYSMHKYFRRDDSRLSLVIVPVDLRVHFALNVGSHAATERFILSKENADESLQWLSETYIRAEVVISGTTIFLPKIFKYYKHDFGTNDDSVLRVIMNFHTPLQAAKIRTLLASGKYGIKYTEYSWDNWIIIHE